MKKWILLSNDDGYTARGIRALYEQLSRFAEITLVAPQLNHSGASNSLTLTRPLFVHTEESSGFHYVNGTPTDCVHLALTTLYDRKPDLIVSGINKGANMGDDVLYSGTVAAAMEGYLQGISSIAFSLTQKSWDYLEPAAEAAAHIVQEILNHPTSEPVLLNVNIPHQPEQDLKKMQVTRLGRRHPAEPAQPVSHPNGESYYWIGPAGAAKDNEEGTDFAAIEQGCISMTPLTINLTHTAQMELCRTWVDDFKDSRKNA